MLTLFKGRAGHKTKRVANLIALRLERSSRDPGTPQVVGRSFAPPFLYSELTELPGGRVVHHTRGPPGKGLTKRIEGVGAPSRSPWRGINNAKCCGCCATRHHPYGPEIGWTIGMFIDLNVSCKILHPSLGCSPECWAFGLLSAGSGPSDQVRRPRWCVSSGRSWE